MSSSEPAAGVVGGRLESEVYARNFADLHPPMSAHEAKVAADRCYFCHDAPCVTACPTAIDIPLFIRQISTGIPETAAVTILEQNILGGMCARACPTEVLCEDACVREVAEGAPVEIGRLQRFATDVLVLENRHPFTRSDETGRHVAVVGSGPAGLACAHRLAMKGHRVTVFEPRERPGGLNEYGIAAYKTVDEFARREVEWLLAIGGIDIRPGCLGEDLDLARLREDYDAVFLGIGLAGVNALLLESGEDSASADQAEDAIAFIARLRQSPNLGELPVGRDVVVVGGGMTAIDAAVQSKLLGAETVTIVYRRDRDRMSASGFEQNLALKTGVRILANARPVRVVAGDDGVQNVEFVRTRTRNGGVEDSGTRFRLRADQLFRAIGQRLDVDAEGLEIRRGKICVDANGRTSLAGVWAGGDCANGGDDLTVTAVANGRDAAEDMHRTFDQEG
ncbi:MAG: NAD(P)-dependent oxidoreductase [Paracoccaceae bacterium]|nr:NAD(P)-dependent oxidoreductase [Paracoccaceae bacterium]